MFGKKQFLACETESITFSLLLSFLELVRVSSGIVVIKFYAYTGVLMFA